MWNAMLLTAGNHQKNTGNSNNGALTKSFQKHTGSVLFFLGTDCYRGRCDAWGMVG